MEINPTTLVGGGIFLVGVVSLIATTINNGNGKRAKIYKRIEQERKDVEAKFVAVNLCNERSGNMVKKLDEISKGVKQILENGK